MTQKCQDIVIEALGASGDGMALLPEGRLYVPLTVPGDRVRVAVRGNGPGGVCLGQALELLESGTQRQVPGCPHHAAIGKDGCGGCSLQQVRQEAYRAFKLGVLETAVSRAGLSPVTWAAPSWTGEGQRRRACFAVQRSGSSVCLGFNQAGSHTICNMETCLVLDQRIVSALPGLRAALAEILKPGETADLQVAVLGNALDVLLVRARPLSAFDVSAFAGPAEMLGIARLSWRRNERAPVEPLLVRQVPEIRMGGFVVRPPAGGFLQVSAASEQALVAAVLEGMANCQKVADLYAGIGTFALPLVAEGKRVLAVDADPEAMAALEDAGRRNVLGERLRILRRNLMQHPMLAKELAGMEGVVLDPPRAGAAAQMDEVVKAGISRVMMVSCNPATFARDAAVLAAAGYRMEKIWPVDQFLYSPHMELAALFAL